MKIKINNIEKDYPYDTITYGEILRLGNLKYHRNYIIRYFQKTNDGEEYSNEISWDDIIIVYDDMKFKIINLSVNIDDYSIGDYKI